MKTKALTSILALFLLGFATLTTNAQTSGQSANGNYQFSLEDEYTKYIEFDAQADGSPIGQVFFSDESEITYQDVDGTEEPGLGETYRGFYFKAEFDGLVVEKNQAVMSGTVRDSNIGNFIGQRVLVTVEDNGENPEQPDHLTWGLYQPLERRWTPSDAEVEGDDGWHMTWIATDAELEDDKGIPYPRDEAITVHSFPISSFDFVEVQRGAGDIKVVP